MKDQNKTDCPNLFEDQLQLLNERAYWKMHYGEMAIITYWKITILRLAMKKSMTIDFFIAIFYSYREE